MLDENLIDFDSYLDIFYFTHNNERKLYENPADTSKSKMIVKDMYDRAYKIIDHTDNFIKIATIHFVDTEAPKEIIPLGWIKIRDENNLLSIWFKRVTLD